VLTFHPLVHPLEPVIDAFTRKKQVLVEGRGPVLLDTVTYRISGHSPSDASSYRSKEEIDRWQEVDSIKAFRAKLVEHNVASDATLDAGVELYRGAAAAAEITQNESGSATKVHSAAMTTGRIREQHVDARAEEVSRGPAHRVDVGREPPFPHHVAAGRYKADSHIEWCLNQNAAADVLRLHIGEPHIDTELMFGAAARGGRTPLSVGCRGERQRERR